MSDTYHDPGTTQPATLEEILCEMNRVGGFQVSVLTSTEGLPIAAVPAGYSSDFMAAMVASIQRTSNDAQSQLGMADVDEVTIRDRDRVRLVCRHIVIGKDKLILAVVVPPGRYSRRATNWAARMIKQMLS